MDEKTLQEWVRRVANSEANRRDFMRSMIALDLTGPMLADILTARTPAWAQTKPAMDDFMPTKRGGGGTLRVLWWQAPTILNAHLGTGTKDIDASRVVYEPLATFDTDANFVPVLAAEMPTRENGGLSADGTSVSWRLKKGVTWHDGKPFTAD